MNLEGKSLRTSAEDGQSAANGLYWVSKAGKIHKPSCRFYGSSDSGTYTDKPSGTDCMACGGLSFYYYLDFK